MNRLTKKFNGEYYRKDADTIMFNSETDYNAIQKLGKLEDIEEELGCPLEVVFRALKDGIIYEKENKYVLIPNLIFAQLLNEDVGDYHFINYDLPNLENNLIVKLSDYRKTWWLKGKSKHARF